MDTSNVDPHDRLPSIYGEPVLGLDRYVERAPAMLSPGFKQQATSKMVGIPRTTMPRSANSFGTKVGR